MSSYRRTRITKDSESSARWALIRCKENTKDETMGFFVRRYSTKWEWSKYFECTKGILLSSEEGESFEEFRKRLFQVGIEHIRRVIRYPDILSNRLLEKIECQEGLVILHLQEKERRICFLRSLGEKRSLG